MALTGSGNVLGLAIAAAIIADNGPVTPAEQLVIENKWKLIATEIVNHFVAQTQVTTTVAVASVSAVTPGPGVSGPGVGTGTGSLL